MTTKIGKFIISTVGEYYPNGPQTKMEIVGLDRFYETFVFEFNNWCECGCKTPEIDPAELDSLAANTREDARRNHIELCLKYDKRRTNQWPK
jgi:hypothetical protein